MCEVWMHIRTAGNALYMVLNQREYGQRWIRCTAITLLEDDLGWKKPA